MAASAALSGQVIKLFVDVNGTQTKVAEQRGLSVTEATAVINKTSKDSRSRKVDPGEYSSTITLDNLLVRSDAALSELRKVQRDGTKIIVQIEEVGVKTEQATCLVSAFDFDAPNVAEATATATLEVDGDWSTV